MGTEPLHVVETEQFKATFMIDQGDQLDRLEFNDVEVALPDGTRWSATLATLAGLARVMDECRVNGVSLNGEYLWFSDLVIVRRMGVTAMVEVIHGLLNDEDEHFEEVFTRLEPDDEETDEWNYQAMPNDR